MFSLNFPEIMDHVLTSAHTKSTNSKEFWNQNFVPKIENFECCEWGQNDILHKRLESSSCPYNLVMGGFITSIFVFTGIF